MADFIKCILVIFEFGIFYHSDKSITTAYRYPSLYDSFHPTIYVDKYINSTNWPANYINEIKRVGSSTDFPAVCIPLVKGIDEVVKKLAYDGYNISIISPKREMTYLGCALEGWDLYCPKYAGISFSEIYNNQKRYYEIMFRNVTDVVNRLKSDSSIANSNCVKFIEVDDCLVKIFEDLSMMKNHNNVYITNNRKYTELMAAFYPSSSTYTLPRQCLNSIDPMIKIIDECLSEKNNNRAAIIYIEDTNLALNFKRYYTIFSRSNDRAIPRFRIMNEYWTDLEI